MYISHLQVANGFDFPFCGPSAKNQQCHQKIELHFKNVVIHTPGVCGGLSIFASLPKLCQTFFQNGNSAFKIKN